MSGGRLGGEDRAATKATVADNFNASFHHNTFLQSRPGRPMRLASVVSCTNTRFLGPSSAILPLVGCVGIRGKSLLCPRLLSARKPGMHYSVVDTCPSWYQIIKFFPGMKSVSSLTHHHIAAFCRQFASSRPFFFPLSSFTSTRMDGSSRPLRYVDVGVPVLVL